MGKRTDAPEKRIMITLYAASSLTILKRKGYEKDDCRYFTISALRAIAENKEKIFGNQGGIIFDWNTAERKYKELEQRGFVRFLPNADISIGRGDTSPVTITEEGKNYCKKLIEQLVDDKLREPTTVKFHDQDLLQVQSRYGLEWLRRDYFHYRTCTDNDLNSWKEGFPFDLPCIKMKQELRRENILVDIKRKLEIEGQLHIIGQPGSSKTTILMELMCDYFDDGYEVLYNYGFMNIRNKDGLVNFIENILRNGKKILVATDNAHDERTSPIFYVIDKLSTYKLSSNLRFIVTARKQKFEDSLDNVPEDIGRSIRKLTLNPNLRYHLPYFSKEEIKQFIRLYSKIIDNNESDKKAEEIYDYTTGVPIMVIFSVFGRGLKEDVMKAHDSYLKSPLSMKTMLICSLLDMSTIKITDAILKRCGVLGGAYSLDGATLSQNYERLWRTKHARWDQELFKFLYNEHSGTLVYRKQVLIDSLVAIYSMNEAHMTHSVIGTLYDIAAQNIVPMDLADAVFQQSIHTYLSNEKKSSFCTFRENQDSLSDERKTKTSKKYLLLEKGVEGGSPLVRHISPSHPYRKEKKVEIGANVIILRRQNDKEKIIIGYGQVRNIEDADSIEKKQKLPEFARYSLESTEHVFYQTAYIDKFVPSDPNKSLVGQTQTDLTNLCKNDTITEITEDIFDQIISETRFD